MIRELQLSTFAKSVSLFAKSVSLSALGLLASVSAMAYPGAPAEETEILKIVSTCELFDKDGHYLLGFTEDISSKTAGGKPCPQNFSIMISDKFYQHKSIDEARANGNEPAINEYAYRIYAAFTKQYRVDYQSSRNRFANEVLEKDFHRNWNALKTATNNYPATVEVEKVSRKIGEIKPTIKVETQKSIELTSACKTGNKVFGYTASIPRGADVTECPDGWQLALTIEEVEAQRDNFQHIRGGENGFDPVKYYRIQNLGIIRSKFGNELFRVETRRQAMADMMLAMTTTSSKHPVLLTVDLERKMILDLSAQANPREF